MYAENASNSVTEEISDSQVKVKDFMDIGVQCELGNEIFCNYSSLFEKTNESSVHTSDFEPEVDDSDTESYKEENEETLEDGCFNASSSHDSQINSNFVLVSFSKLLSLFKTCSNCGLPVIELKTFAKGAVLRVTSTCGSGHFNKWSSSSELDEHSSSDGGNVALAASIYLCGMNFSTFTSFANTLKLLCISEQSYYIIVRKYIAPVLYDEWEKHKESNFEEASKEKEVWISGDGQYDSPGFSAKYITYSIMDLKTNKILDFVLLQRGMVEGELEQAACEKALSNITRKLPITLFLSDRHRGVGALMKKKFQHIHHEYDVWHLAKSLGKKLKTAGKKSQTLSQWMLAINKHLWWSSETCNGDGDILISKFTSLLKHIVNVHEWQENGELKTCQHGELNPEESTRIKWMHLGSEEYNILHREIMNKTFLNDLKHTNHYCHTGYLESYHNLRLKYVPKRVHFSYEGMTLRSILAILDHNSNIHRNVTGGDVQFSKSSQQWVYKNKFENKNDRWRDDLFRKIIQLKPMDKRSFTQLDGLPKNIYKKKKPTLEDAKLKHFSRFKSKK